MAFFPCIRFEEQILLWFRGESSPQRNWKLDEKMENCIRLQDELSENYKLVNMLFIICYRKNLQLIMENPYGSHHYLNSHWCYKASVIDLDRRKRGDYFKKPTQYWFLNRLPHDNLVFEIVNDNSTNGSIENVHISKKEMGLENVSSKIVRSMIHPEYANRFIKEFIL